MVEFLSAQVSQLKGSTVKSIEETRNEHKKLLEGVWEKT